MAQTIAVSQSLIALLALAISLLTFIALRKKASEERISTAEACLYAEISQLKEAVAECRMERDACERERILLLERIAQRRV